MLLLDGALQKKPRNVYQRYACTCCVVGDSSASLILNILKNNLHILYLTPCDSVNVSSLACSDCDLPGSLELGYVSRFTRFFVFSQG